MPNDAKLGLLAGVVGVILAAAVSADRPPPAEQAAGSPAAAPADPKPDAPAALPADFGTTPVARSRPEPEATPAGRKPKRDVP